jgi:hypothetical protein
MVKPWDGLISEEEQKARASDSTNLRGNVAMKSESQTT